MKRLSLHIGLNRIDPAVYGEGNDLVNCINDCDFYTEVATENGFTPTILKDEEATAARVTAEFSKAASTLGSGDYFLVTYAGHGSQLPDEDNEEDDGMNETWVLYDRQMVDNEIYRMWSYFEPGVKIFVLSDSCHSGTLMRKAMIQVKPLIRKLSPLTRTFRSGYTKGAREAEPLNVETLRTRILKISEEEKAESADRETSQAEKVRLLSIEASLRNYVDKRDLYRNVMLLAGDKREIDITATLLYISGCQDNQTSGDGPAGTNGVFTGKLKQVWNDGSFTGNYFDLYKRIIALMPPVQSPNYMKLGTTNTVYETEKPFGAFQEGEAVIPQPETKPKAETGPSEPVDEPATVTITGSVGQGGENKSADVGIIQTLLNKIPADEGGPSVKLKVDGFIGPKTINAIKGFQMFYGYDNSDDFGLVSPGSDTFSELSWRSSRAVTQITVSN